MAAADINNCDYPKKINIIGRRLVIESLADLERDEPNGGQSLTIEQAQNSIIEIVSSCINNAPSLNGTKVIQLQNVLEKIKALDALPIGVFVFNCLIHDGFRWARDIHVHNLLCSFSLEILIQENLLDEINSEILYGISDDWTEIDDLWQFVGRNELSVFGDNYEGEPVFGIFGFSFQTAKFLISRNVRFDPNVFLSREIELHLYRDGIINDSNKNLYRDKHEAAMDYDENYPKFTKESSSNNTYMEFHQAEFFRDYDVSTPDHLVLGVKFDTVAREDLEMSSPFYGMNFYSGCYLIIAECNLNGMLHIIPIYAGKTGNFKKRLWDHWCHPDDKKNKISAFRNADDQSGFQWATKRYGTIDLSANGIVDFHFAIWIIKDKTERMYFEYGLIHKFRPLMNK